ncbi:MAG: hypothetical protein CSB48_03200 [Proteobacteria bacterium]|nr:MAG: hypothetical protein CSB48_03200 [Pseudomonadota bacterium]
MYPEPARALQKGIGLPGALFVLVILALIVVALTNMEIQRGEAFVQDIQSTRAWFAAESGAQAGLSHLLGPGESGSCPTACASGSSVVANLNLDSVSGGAPPGLSRCGYSVTCCRQVDSDGNVYYSLTSTGFCGDAATPLDRAQRIIEVGVRAEAP